MFTSVPQDHSKLLSKNTGKLPGYDPIMPDIEYMAELQRLVLRKIFSVQLFIYFI